MQRRLKNKYQVFITIVKGVESEVCAFMSLCRKYLRSLVCFCVCVCLKYKALSSTSEPGVLNIEDRTAVWSWKGLAEERGGKKGKI